MTKAIFVLGAIFALPILTLISGHPHLWDTVRQQHEARDRPARSVPHHNRQHHRHHGHGVPLVDFGGLQSDERTTPENAEMQRLKNLVMHSQDKVVDFERGRHMDANDEAVRQSTWWGPADNDTLQLYVQRNCTSCLMREEAKLNRIERIKEDLLQKLGIKILPNTTDEQAPPSVPNLQGILSKWGFSADNTMSADQAMAMDQPLVETPPSSNDAKTERVYAFATKGRQKFFNFFLKK